MVQTHEASEIGQSGRIIEREMVIKATPEQVFAAFTEKEAIESWFVERAEVDPRIGGIYTFYWKTQHVSGRVIEFDPPHRVVMEFDERPYAPGITVTSVTLTPVEGGTLFRFVHSGFGPESDWDALYYGVRDGWPTAFNEMQIWLETGVPVANGFRHQ